MTTGYEEFLETHPHLKKDEVYEMRFVYHLIDPLSKEVFYVGSTNDPGRRLQEHVKSFLNPPRFNSDNKEKILRIKNIIENGQYPVMRVVFSKVCSKSEIIGYEFEEMKKYKNLTNATNNVKRRTR